MRTPIPSEPLSLDRVIERWPTMRQSLLGEYDNCPLGAFLAMKYASGWSTTPQARGTLLHRATAEILRTMQRQGHQTIPVREALEILVEVCRQQDVPPEEIVRVPLRQVKEMRMAITKLAKDNAFSTHKIVDIEKRLEATISYTTSDGERITRRLTGQLDVLLFDPPDGAVVLDHKFTWGLPPEPRDSSPQGYDDEELKGLSFMGYYQQRFYGFLVMSNYRNINQVTLREWFPYVTKVRKATLYRHQLPDVEEELSVLAQAFDAALMQGAPSLRPDADGLVNVDELGWWKPQPGRHCSFCVRPTACPIPEDVRVAAGGAVTSEESAARWAARFTIAERIRKAAIEGLKGWVEGGGAPVPVKWSKGRQFIGWYSTKRGRRFGLFVPDQSDRGGHAEVDKALMDAMRFSTKRAREERGVKPRKRGRSRA